MNIVPGFGYCTVFISIVCNTTHVDEKSFCILLSQLLYCHVKHVYGPSKLAMHFILNFHRN